MVVVVDSNHASNNSVIPVLIGCPGKEAVKWLLLLTAIILQIIL